MHEGEIVGGDALREVLQDAGSGQGPTLVLVDSKTGLAGPILDLLPDRLRPLRRAVGAEATQAKVGCIADTVDLSEGSGAIVVENAQWVDSTSLGRIQRLLKSDGSGLVIVVAHTPVAPEDAWWLEGLEAAARKNGSVITTEFTGAADSSVDPPADEAERTLVLASTLVSEPIPVAAVARLLDVPEPEALGVAERLTRRGLLREGRSGFLASPAGLTIEAGAARLGHVAGKLATAFAETGQDPSVVGSLFQAAGDETSAFPLLRDAATSALAKGASGEAYHLASAALAAAAASSLGSKSDLGELHLIAGQHLRAAGRSGAAFTHLEEAVSLLKGPARIDALGFAASVADDRQHPQEAERILAIGEWEAARQDELAKLGSLGTFRARALNRLGFASESDALLAKASAILDAHATATQQFYATVNNAWILFDRGQVARAEAEFTQLRDGTDHNDLAGLADKEAWRARALFATGHVDEALEAVEAAREHATAADLEAPIFLADLGLAEGGLLLHRFADTLDATDRVLDLVERLLPAWENVARSNRALALMGLGRLEEATTEIEAALAATPPGSDGWRWRLRCRAIQIEIATLSGHSLPQREAEDLADMFLQSEFYGWATETLCVIAEHTKSEEPAREALALATQMGNPMLAARAAQAGGLWREPGAAPTIRALKAMETRLPEEWVEEWKAISAVSAGLAAPEPAEDETGAENSEVLEEALRRAGLVSTDTILSPAQRRSRGLVRHRRRRRSPLALTAAALGVIVLAVGTSLAVARLTTPDTIPEVNSTEDTAPPTTVPPELEDTQIAVPVDLLFGTALDRGDAGRTGYVNVSGPRTVDGYYWKYQAADAIVATPLAYGNNLLVGSADGTFQAIDLTDGHRAWSMTAEAQIATSGTLASAGVGEGGAIGVVVVVGDDGIARARDAVIVEQGELWNPPTRLGARIRSSPVADGTNVYVATTDGRVHALDLATGNEVWTYPGDDAEPFGPITAGLALDNGILYVGSEDGGLHLINTDGTLVCETTLDGSIRVNPVVVDARAYISVGSVLRIFPAGVCEVLISDTVQYLSETVIDVAPAVVGDLIYLPNGIFLNAINRTAVEEGMSDPTQAHHWSPGQVKTDGKIASPPVVTNDAVYFGTESGWVYAVDSDTGELLWEWKTDNYVRASPVVIDGAAYIASGDGNVYAVGPAG